MLLLLACVNEPEQPLPGVCTPQSQELGASALNFEGAAPQNLLVISIDTLRRDRIGRYDASATTPFLDSVLQDAVVLDDFRSCSNWTYPSMSCLMTGQSMTNLGLDPILPDASIVGLSDTQETLATWLLDTGWQTMLVTSSKIFGSTYPMTNGFQQVLDSRQEGLSLVDASLENIRQLDMGQKWYFHVHFTDPHYPYRPPVKYQGDLAGRDLSPYDPRKDGGLDQLPDDWKRLSEEEQQEVLSNIDILYRGEIAYMDAEISRLWESLQAGGYLENTLVLIVSDHGEQHFEHGGLKHEQSLHAQEGMGIAALWAANLEPLAWQGPVNHQDLAPTVLSAFQLEIPDTVEGLEVGTAPEDRLRFSSGIRDGRPVQSVDRLGLRMIFDWDAKPELYDLRVDPEELRDLMGSSPEEEACMWDALHPMVERVDTEVAGGPPRRPAYR